MKNRTIIMGLLALILLSPALISPLPLAEAQTEPSVYRGANYIDTDLGDGTHIWESAPQWVFNESSAEYVPYIYTRDEAKKCYIIQSGLIAAEIYDTGIAKFYDPVLMEERVKSETWEVWFLDKDVWKRASLSSAVSFTVTENDYSIVIESDRATSKPNGLLTVKYTFVQGKPLKHDITWFSQNIETELIKIDQLWDLKLSTDKVVLSDGNLITTSDRTNSTNFLFGDSENDFLVKESQWAATYYPNGTKREIGFIDADIDIAGKKDRFTFGNWTIAEGESLEIDPVTQTLSNPTQDGHIKWDASPGDYTRDTSGDWLYQGASTDRDWRSYVQWSTSGIPDSATITNTVFKYHGYMNGRDSHIHDMDGTYSQSDDDLWDDMGGGTIYAAPVGFPEVGINKQVDLGPDADSTLQAQLGANWFAIGIQGDSESPENMAKIYSENYASATPPPTLVVTWSNRAPTITSASILDRDDTDNVYAMESYYSFVGVVNDVDLATDISKVYMRGMNGAATLWEVRGDNLAGTASYSIQTGSDIIDLDTVSCTFGKSGTVGTITFKVRTEGDHGNLDDLELAVYVQDVGGYSAGWTTMQTDYWDAINRLVIENLATNDGNINIGGSTTISGNVRYATTTGGNTASSKYPPDTAFTSVNIHDASHVLRGTDASIVNGAFSAVFNIPSIMQLNTYHAYLSMAGDWADGDAPDGDTVSVIGNRIEGYYEELDDSHVNVSDTIEYRVKFRTDYEDHELGSGDTVVANSGAMAWDAGNGWFDDQRAPGTVGEYVFSISSVSEATYGITAYFDNSPSRTGIWDQLEVISVTFNDSHANINDPIEVRYVIEYEYDGAPFTGSNGSIVGYDWDSVNEWWEKDINAPASPSAVNYDETDLGAITDNEYGITALKDVAGATMVGDRWKLTDLWASNEYPQTGATVTLYATGELEYNGHVSDGDDVLVIEGLSFPWDWENERFYCEVNKSTAGALTYDTLTSITEYTYNITAGNVNGQTVTVTWGDYQFHFYGLYYENGTRNGAVNISSHMVTETEIFEVDGYLPKAFTEEPLMFSYALTGGGTRYLYKFNDNETLKIFTPESTYTVYSFTIRDYTGQVGQSNSYLESLRIINGTNHMIERMLIQDTANTIPLTLVQSQIYTLRIRFMDGSTYPFGTFIPGSEATPTLSIYEIDPSEQIHYIGEDITVAFLRPTNTHIRINYKDDAELTTSIFVEVCLMNGTQVWNDTSTETVKQFNWYGAEAATDYLVNLVAQHPVVGSVYASGWLTGAKPEFEEIPDFDAMIGEGANTAFAVFLIFSSFLLFSRDTALLGTFFAVIMTYITIYLGFLDMPYLPAHVVMGLVIMWGVSQGGTR